MGHMIRDKGIGHNVRYIKWVTSSGIKEWVTCQVYEIGSQDIKWDKGMGHNIR